MDCVCKLPLDCRKQAIYDTFTYLFAELWFVLQLH